MKQELEDLLSKSSVLFDYDTLCKATKTLAQALTDDYHDKMPIILCVINGAIVPISQLLMHMHFPLQLDSIRASRYHGEIKPGNQLTWHATPLLNLEGRHVLVFDDILDGGITLSGISNYCHEEGAETVKTAVMIDKKTKRDEGGLAKADYTGLEVDGSAFLIGYGMDYKGYLRNLPEVRKVD